MTVYCELPCDEGSGGEIHNRPSHRSRRCHQVDPSDRRQAEV